MPDFSTLIKPASSLCNMRCRYCFYADECASRSVKSFGIMSAETSHKLIDRAYEYTDCGNVLLAFQGGEPLVAGYGFFEDFVGYAIERKPEKVVLSFSLQTNGTLIDEDFCRLFAKHKFLIGLSVDGPENLNDVCRVDSAGEGTFKRVMNAARLMSAYKVDFNILSVITKYNATHPQQLWSFYKKNRFDFVQLIPCLPPLDAEQTEFDFSPSGKDYASFLSVLFRLWADDLMKGRYISVRLFDNLVKMAMGEYPEMCGMLGFCSAQFVIEADGGVYPCDFYAVDRYLAGNVHDLSFEEIRSSLAVSGFLKEGAEKPDTCRECGFYRICRGGCRRYRGYFTGAEKCPYAEFLSGSVKRISEIAGYIKNKNKI